MDGEKLELADGVTLRDYFASQALPGIIAGFCRQRDDELPHERYAAKTAYEYADAMLEARESWRTAESLNGRR